MNLHSLLGNIRKKNLMAAGVRRQKKHRARLHIDTLEDRAVPAVQVGPTVEGNFRHIFQGSATNPEGWGVSMAADPMNPNQIVAAYVMHASSGTRIALAYTTNGGTSWNSQGFIENRNCPRPHNPPVLNSDVSDPSIAWDRFGNFWLTYTEDHDGHTAGHLILRKYRFSGAPSLQSDRIMYSWVDGTEAYTPQVAIDSNRPTSFDPVLGNLDPQGIAVDPLAASQLDQNSVKIFLTYNLRPAAAGAKTGADAIVLRYSADGGQKFQAPLFMNDEGFLPLGNPDYVFSKTVFTPGRANEPDSGGRMVTLMSRGGTIRSDSISFSGPNGTPGLQDFLPDFGLAKDIANATQTGTTVEIETTTPHHFTVGTRVNIAGVSVGGYNGTHFVTAVVDANRFQYTLLTTGLGAGTGGTATLNTAIVDAVDPGNNAPHIVTPTVIPIHVPAGAVPKIDNIAIDLRINHENLSELDVRLRSPDPDGAGPLQGRVVQLVRERITNNGTDRTNQGIGLAGTSMDSTFVDSAPQTINQGTAPYRWFWRPELDSLEIQYTGLNPSQFEGEWEVIIRDNRASNVGSVPNNGITLWLGQGIRSRWVDSSGVLHRAGTDRATGAVSAVAEDRGLSHPNKPTFAPQSGVGPGLVATVDTTVGAFSPYQNRVYFAYSTGSSIQVMYTDGVDTREGNLWSTAPTTVDAGYLPQIAVDPSTGALYVAYYSAKYDASNTRSTMFMSSAINMPDYRTRSPNIEFAPGEWVTEQETALDPIRTKTIITEPIPSNGPVASDVRMWGNSIGMTIFDSHVVLVYPGNRNNNGTELRTQNIEVQGGPRVVWTDSGPVLGDASISGNFDAFSYNLETFDGRNAFSGFGVEFDRIIDPATFNPDDVKVIFRGPEDDPVGSGTEVLVDSIHRVDQFRDPVDTSDYGSKRFFVQLDAPQTNVGTYSVLIGADSIGGITSIKDRVRDQKFTYTANGEVITYNYPLVGTANDQIEDFAGGSTPLNTVINVPTAKNITTATQNAFGTVTITTTTAHNLTVGSTVIIAGVSVPGYNGTHTVTNVVGGTQFQYSLAPGLANGAGGTARSPNAFSLGTVILDITVRVDITHEQVSDLQIDLIAPNNQAVRLVRQGDAFGVDFQNTQFNDGAALTLGGGFAPYTDTFIPAESLLGKLFGDNPGGNSGNWTLRINDMAAGDTGVLNSWSMTIVGASTPAINIFNGNFMDQDGDGVSNESPVDLDAGPGVLFGTRDGYALPNPTPILDPTLPNPGPGDNVITPFVLPYSNTSMPIVVPGPRLLESRVIGHPSTTDQLVKNTSVSSIDLYFDRIIDAASFSAADVIRITGPLGNIPLTGVTVSPITAGGALLAAGTDSEYFRISGFAAQNLSGTYTIQLSSQIADGQGNLLDTNFNAGVGNLVGNVSGSDVTTEPYGGDPLNGGNGFIVPAKGTTTVNLNITDGYLIQRATANLTVVFPSLLVPNPDPPPAPPFIQVPTTEYANLEGRLIAPNGTTVLLFSDSPTSGEGNMTNLTFTDASFATPTTPPGPPISVASIEDGFVANGFNNPILPLAQLISQPSSGTWKLQIKNKGNIAARVDKFALELDKPVIPSGLGEAIADRTVVSFRIANTDGSTALSKSNWSPVGPAPQIDLNAENSTAGRVSSIAVDPSDPSGNTVYAAGASGGVWRTTNFLTRDPDGPVWVPLADFGPNNATNVGYLAVYNSKTDPNTNGDPEKTVILVGTGSEALNVIDEEDERRFDGIGFLLSEDAGKTWKVLDSTDNYDNAIDKYRPFVDAQAAPVNLTSASQVGTTVTIQTPTPHAYPVGTVVTISGVSVAGYNGTFVVTGVPGPNHFTYNTAAGLANGTGGTSQAVDRRNHFFMGTVVNKIVFEKNPNVFTNRPIIWAAVGQGVTPNGANMEGLWRSIDGARTWTQVFQGEATDFVLAPGSQLINSNDRPTIGYLAVQGVGTYFISNLDSDLPTFTLMNGGVGRPTVNGGSMTVLPPLDTPIGAFGRIAIASPAFVRGDALANVNYQHWLYVAVSNTDGTFRGLYMTKDRGDNWTRVKLTGTGGPNGGPGSNGGFSDAGNDIDIMINPSPPADDDGGNHSITLAVDPNDPNVVYFGSNRLLKVDTTLIADPYNATPYNHSNNEGGTWTNTFDGLQGGSGVGQNILNLVRNPFSPFTSDTSLSVSAANFQNNGRDVRWVLADAVGDGEGSGDFNWVSQIISFIDPITGMARVAFGTDEGITSFVIDPNVKPSQSPRGNTNQMNGFNQHFQVEDNGSFETDIQVNG
jgi:subtilisin-like proprotein convertase family protein